MAFMSTGVKVKLNDIEALSTRIELELVNEIAMVDILITDDLTINKLEEMLENMMFVQITTTDGSILDYKANKTKIVLEPQEIMIARLECERVKRVK